MSSRWMLAGLLMMSLSSLSTGCRTDVGDVPSVARLRDRIGKMTFDDAVRQMGPPATKTELRDRSVVAEWTAGTETRPSFSFGLGSGDAAAAAGDRATLEGGVAHRFRELQFDQAGRLVSVKDVKR